MKFFETKKSESYTVIIGCGKLGASLANALSDEGENVLVVDDKKEAFRRLASNFGGLTVLGNGTDLDVLNQSQIHRASAVIAVTRDDNTNIMIAQIARDIYHVDRVIARLYDPECESVYKKLGIDTICPSVLSARRINKILGGSSVKEVNP